MPSGPERAEATGWVYVQLSKGEVLLLAMRDDVPLWLSSGAEWPCCDVSAQEGEGSAGKRGRTPSRSLMMHPPALSRHNTTIRLPRISYPLPTPIHPTSTRASTAYRTRWVSGVARMHRTWLHHVAEWEAAMTEGADSRGRSTRRSGSMACLMRGSGG